MRLHALVFQPTKKRAKVLYPVIRNVSPSHQLHEVLERDGNPQRMDSQTKRFRLGVTGYRVTPTGLPACQDISAPCENVVNGQQSQQTATSKEQDEEGSEEEVNLKYMRTLREEFKNVV